MGEKTIHKILIANRGEIALRIQRSSIKLGIEPVAIFAEFEKDAEWIKHFDQAYELNGQSVESTYLNKEVILQIARKANCDAIHPGYGFLSENAEFAELCAHEGIEFLGPTAEVIRSMGDKDQARKIMQKLGVPLIPGFALDDVSEKDLQTHCEEMGYPILIKAAAGGGGKGMRKVSSYSELTENLEGAKRESKAFFGNDALLIEKYIEKARHIEVQVFGDKKGEVIHLGERECTLQRRHQKIVEESPSPTISDGLRTKICETSQSAAEKLSYSSAGTFEFVVDEDENFYFLEVNTRLQVEHGVTEETFGVDLVGWQIQVGMHKPLSDILPKKLNPQGHSIEVRLYSEDPQNSFLPTTGSLSAVNLSKLEGARYDMGVFGGDSIGSYFDPMVGKFIATGLNRHDATSTLQYMLKKSVVLGTVNNQSFLINLLDQDWFQTAKWTTQSIENWAGKTESFISNETAFELACVYFLTKLHAEQPNSLPNVYAGFRNVGIEKRSVKVEIAGHNIELKGSFKKGVWEVYSGEEDPITQVQLIEKQKHILRVKIDQKVSGFWVQYEPHLAYIKHPSLGAVKVEEVLSNQNEEDAVANVYRSPMNGQITKIFVESGSSVKKGEKLMVLTSMKMENDILAAKDGVVDRVEVSENSFVEAKKVLLRFEV